MSNGNKLNPEEVMQKLENMARIMDTHMRLSAENEANDVEMDAAATEMDGITQRIQADRSAVSPEDRERFMARSREILQKWDAFYAGVDERKAQRVKALLTKKLAAAGLDVNQLLTMAKNSRTGEVTLELPSKKNNDILN